MGLGPGRRGAFVVAACGARFQRRRRSERCQQARCRAWIVTGAGNVTDPEAVSFEFLVANCSSDEPTLRFELDRYLGWPGQAPSYKVGERIWLEARDEARRRKHGEFNLRQFHADALNLGSLGLDPLRAGLARI